MDRVGALMNDGLDAVAKAGAIARRYFRTMLAVDNKLGEGGFDPVTQADREIELFLRAELGRHGLRMVGEEFAPSGDGDDYWIIDPIDGTRAFMSGMPTWGILLGLVMGGRAVGGIMHQPFTGEFFVGDPSRGSRWLHAGIEQRLAGSRKTVLEEAVIYSTDPSIIEAGGLTQKYGRLGKQCRLQRWGGDCYGLALVAQGGVDVMVEGMLAPYDIVPLIAIIEQAGGVVTDLAGRSPLQGGSVVAAGNANLHEAAVAFLV